MNATSQSLLFSRGPYHYALPADLLVCQLSTFACAVLADPPAGMVGYFSFAGEALPMLDMAAVNNHIEVTAKNCLVVHTRSEQQLGLLSDTVADLTDTPALEGQINLSGRQYAVLTTQTLQALLSGDRQ